MIDDRKYRDISGIFKPRGSITIKNIIKEKTINYSVPISVGGESSFLKSDDQNLENQHEIKPIVENDEVVGVIHYCSCGRATEIRFDY